MLDAPIRYGRTTDGRSIAVSIVGAGPPAVLCNAVGHLVEDLRSPIARPWIEALAAGCRLLRYDGRGSGLSDRDVDRVDLETTLLDLSAAVDAAGYRRAALLTSSLGSPIAIAWAALNPDRVDRLVIVGGYARGLNHRTTDPRLRAERDAVLAALEADAHDEASPGAMAAWSTLSVTLSESERRAHARWLQAMCSGRTLARHLRWFANVDVSELATRVACPVLVLHSPRDLRIPFDEGRRMAALFRDARLVTFDSDHNVPYSHESAHATVAAELLRFLAAADQSPAPG